MESFFIGILILFVSAFLSLLFKNQTIKLKFITLASIVASYFTCSTAIKVFLSGEQVENFNFGFIFESTPIVFDNLSSFFIIIISIMSSLALIYSNGYLLPYIKKGKDISAHCVFLLLLVASMLSVVVIQNALAFLVAWEIMSLSSFFLVVFEHEKKEVLASGIKYLVFMHISVIFIILAFALLAINAHSYEFSEFKQILYGNSQFSNLVFILAFIGFGIKSGFVLMHNWLPDAHPAAPSHVSAIMSGVMIKTGIYGILRMIFLIGNPAVEIGYFVLIISIITALYGILYVVGQNDIKKLLAYSSIENIGIIGVGLGVGILGLAYNSPIVATLGFLGGLLHILNHSIFKELLFLCAGSVYIKTHTRDIEIMGGLIKKMPVTAALFVIGSIAICALPPLNGFISEFLIYFGILKGILIDNLAVLIVFVFVLASLALVGTMALLCFTKAISIMFLGQERSENVQKVENDVSLYCILPMIILAIFIFAIGLFPQKIISLIMLPVVDFVGETFNFKIIETIQIISIISFSMLAVMLLLFSLKLIFKNKYEKQQTWGCGYNKPNALMQYSASSYVSPFLTMLTPLFKRVVDIKKPKTIFPKDAHFELHMEEIEEEYFLKPILKSTEKFFARFEKMQNGNIQQYIAYGLIFLVLSLVGVVLLG